MRDQLVQYVNLLFAGNGEAEDIRQEILQNTLDRYDDLIDQGKTPEAAYRMAITGIGDISTILGEQKMNPDSSDTTPHYDLSYTERSESSEIMYKFIRAVAIGMYIISPVPILILDMLNLDVLGVCFTLAIVAAATILMMVFGKKKTAEPRMEPVRQEAPTRKKALKKSINNIVSTGGLILYFLVSFKTGAWAITWLIFPLIGAVNGLVNACMDLKENN